MTNPGVDYYALRQNIRKLRGLYIDAGREISALADFAASLDIFWDGDANTAFMTALTRDMAEIGGIMTGLKGLISAANRAFDMYMQCEKEVKNMIGELNR